MRGQEGSAGNDDAGSLYLEGKAPCPKVNGADVERMRSRTETLLVLFRWMICQVCRRRLFVVLVGRCLRSQLAELTTRLFLLTLLSALLLF